MTVRRMLLIEDAEDQIFFQKDAMAKLWIFKKLSTL